MLRFCQRLLHSLPFVPMALSTLDTLEQRIEAAQLCHTATATACTIGGNERADLLRWFTPQCASPFFISPKHDGVRLVSYVPPPDAPVKRRSNTAGGLQQERQRRTSAAAAAAPPAMTCYSRYGRPIYGLFWIEEELRLLRALCGDARLIVDGELYLHHTDMEGIQAMTPATNATAATTRQTTRKRATKTERTEAELVTTGTVSPAQNFKTGFLAVSALVHRLRGSSSQCATAEDVLRYVPALPHLCLFDIPSYSPCQDPVRDAEALASPEMWAQRAPTPEIGDATLRAKERRFIDGELQRVRRQVMEDLSIRDVEQLRVVPNMTPFSQRLRTLTFLLHLLETAMASEVLRAHFCPSSPLPQPLPPVGKRALSRQQRGRKDASVEELPYHGGRYVQRIPYELATSLDDVQRRILPRYLRQQYEGAVIRTPVNPYDFAEKQKGTIASLVAPLLRADAAASRRRHGRRLPDALLLSLSSSSSNSASGNSSSRAPLMVRAYSNGVSSAEPLNSVNPASVLLSEAEQDAVDAVAVGTAAVQRARRLPRRSETAVKVLAYHDKEYAILRPLLKEPSRNPNTRVLVSIPRASVASLGYPIKPDTDTADEEVGGGSDGGMKKAPRKSAAAAAAVASDVVVFYGLQCLSESGLAFNVTMPKLSLAQQKALLDHLLSAGRRAASSSTSSAAGGRSGKRKDKAGSIASLTGLYATVKYSSLTEHGLPRFGTVKAIRGGKGWFM